MGKIKKIKASKTGGRIPKHPKMETMSLEVENWVCQENRP
jgi:hypothetical protein